MKNKIYTLIFTIILTANAGYTMPASVKGILAKFSFAMIGVLISALFIFLILKLYKKYNSEIQTDEEILKHPKTKDEAIKFYIRKNKI